MRRSIGLSVAGLAAVAATTIVFAVPTLASSESDTPGREDAAPSQAAVPAELPLAAFKRSPDSGDLLPRELSAGAQTVTGQPGGESRLIAEIAGTRVYAQVAGTALCFGTVSPSGIGSMTCNAPDGLDEGWFLLESQNDIIGLVNDGTTSVELLGADGGRLVEAPVHAGAYVIAGAADTVAAVRFDPGDGSGQRTVNIPVRKPRDGGTTR